MAPGTATGFCLVLMAGTVACTQVMDPIEQLRAEPIVNSTGGTAGFSEASGGLGAVGATGLGATGGTPVDGGTGAAPGTTGGTGGGGSTVEPIECPLLVDKGGQLLANECGFQGYWYTYNDCTNVLDGEDCTTNQQPSPNEPVQTEQEDEVCTRGRTAAPPDYSTTARQWGAGLGLKLNDKQPLGELGERVVGFRFDLVSRTPEALPELRVDFPMSEPDQNPYLEQCDPTQATRFTIYFTVGKEPGMIDPLFEADRDFVPANVLAIQFQIPTKPEVALDFDVCIKNLTAIVRPP